MDLEKCEKCRFTNDENCFVYGICKIIEAAGATADLKELLTNNDSPAVDWALKQA